MHLEGKVTKICCLSGEAFTDILDAEPGWNQEPVEANLPVDARPFTFEELETAFSHMKSEGAAGLDSCISPCVIECDRLFITANSPHHLRQGFQ